MPNVTVYPEKTKVAPASDRRQTGPETLHRLCHLLRKFQSCVMSDSELDLEEKKIVRLTDIPNLSELYKNSEIQGPTTSDQVRHEANASLLERISL